MTKIKIIDNEVSKYPYTQTDFRKDFPNISFGNKWWNSNSPEKYGIYEVTIDVTPSYDSNLEKVITNDPELIDNVWTVTKEIVEISEEELQAIADIPLEITALQGLLWLNNNNLYDTFKQFTDGLTGADKIITDVMMYEKAVWKSNNDLIQAFFVNIANKSQEEIKNIFKEASLINPF